MGYRSKTRPGSIGFRLCNVQATRPTAYWYWIMAARNGIAPLPAQSAVDAPAGRSGRVLAFRPLYGMHNSRQISAVVNLAVADWPSGKASLRNHFVAAWNCGLPLTLRHSSPSVVIGNKRTDLKNSLQKSFHDDWRVVTIMKSL